MLGESNSVSGYVGIQKSFMHWFCNYKWLHVCWVSYCSFVREGNFNFNNIRRPKVNCHFIFHLLDHNLKSVKYFFLFYLFWWQDYTSSFYKQRVYCCFFLAVKYIFLLLDWIIYYSLICFWVTVARATGLWPAHGTMCSAAGWMRRWRSSRWGRSLCQEHIWC